MSDEMKKPLSQVWELDSIFPGGSESLELEKYLRAVAKEMDGWRERLENLEAPERKEEAAPLTAAVDALQSISSRLRQAGAFTSCLVAQDTGDRRAAVVRARVGQMYADLQALWTQVDEIFLAIDDSLWRSLLHTSDLQEVAESLDERRTWAGRKLPPDKEALVGDLAVDGYHAWGELYNHISGSMRVPFEKDGETVDLSVGQAQNKWMHDEDRGVRSRLFTAFEDVWEENAELCSRALNHLGGFRLALYRQRGWDSVLDEPLEYNRISRATLDAMWAAAEEGKSVLSRYLERKASLLGLPRLTFYDVEAPVGKTSTEWSYDEAAEFIVAQFDRFSPKMANFARNAFQGAWIEAEDRPGKRAGGFCTSFPETHESRIFLTYDNSLSTAATVAHELGHAFHHSVFRDVPYLQTGYPMNLAETASTLAEQIVADAGLRAAADDEERLALLDAKARKSVAFLMNIHARFLFELQFYDERKEDLVPVDRLNELMLEAQQRAYTGALDTYHPLFWAAKLHFYITGVPFYNFPYTFGYLFSHGIYQWALDEGNSFEARYESLLRDTGFMPTEELAHKHFGADLTSVDFWRTAVDRALEDARSFLQLTEE